MEPINKSDRLVKLLKLRLEEHVKSRTAAHAKSVAAVKPRGIEVAREITGNLARAGVEDRYLRRSLVEQLLADQFGAKLVNDAKFQNVIDQVAEVMNSDLSVQNLISEVLSQLMK